MRWPPVYLGYPYSPDVAAWDDGVRWFSRRTVDPDELALPLQYVNDMVLRVTNDGYEDDFVEAAIIASTQAAEDDTHRAIMPQTWELVLDTFPSSGEIILPRPPLIEIVSVTYYDGDEAEQTLAGSPADYLLVPSGAYTKARIKPLLNASFPSTAARRDAVTITYRAGYASETDPVLALIRSGIGIMVAELYKQRSLSVQEPNNTKANLDLSRFWREVR